MNVLVVGSIGIDTIETPCGERAEILGGSASHFSLAVSPFGSQVRMVGVVGTDFPDEFSRLFTGKGIDIDGIERVEGKTFRWKGKYEDFSVATTLDTQLNVFEHFRPSVPQAYRDSDIVFLANIDPLLQEQVLQQVSRPRLTVMDTMNFWISSKKDEVLRLFGKVDVVLVNDQEAVDLTGCRHAVDAGKKLLEQGCAHVIVKKGEHGAIMLSEDDIFSCPAFPSKAVVDTTGAGDSFAGGFTGHLTRSEIIDRAALRKAVVYGCVMGSFNIEGFGTERTEGVDITEIERRFKFIKEMSRF